MFHEEIIPLIIEKYASFTKVEQVIADYFLNERDSEKDLSVKAIKEKLYVSEASCSRFAQKLGFQGYREFVYEYKQSAPEWDTSTSASLENVMKRYDRLLKNFQKVIDDQQIIRIAEMIAQTGKTLVVGVGCSGLVAEEMQNRYSRIGINIESCRDSDLMKMKAILAEPQSLVIGLSLSGIKEEILFTLKHANQRGAKTILITGKGMKKDHLDELVVIPMLKNMECGNLISPQFPELVVIDLIYQYLINRNKNRRLLHQKTLEVLENEKEFKN